MISYLTHVSCVAKVTKAFEIAKKSMHTFAMHARIGYAWVIDQVTASAGEAGLA